MRKYKEAVKTLLLLQKTDTPMQQICDCVMQKHTIGKTTFYNILRIINNTEKR